MLLAVLGHGRRRNAARAVRAARPDVVDGEERAVLAQRLLSRNTALEVAVDVEEGLGEGRVHVALDRLDAGLEGARMAGGVVVHGDVDVAPVRVGVAVELRDPVADARDLIGPADYVPRDVLRRGHSRARILGVVRGKAQVDETCGVDAVVRVQHLREDGPAVRIGILLDVLAEVPVQVGDFPGGEVAVGMDRRVDEDCPRVTTASRRLAVAGLEPDLAGDHQPALADSGCEIRVGGRDVAERVLQATRVVAGVVPVGDVGAGDGVVDHVGPEIPVPDHIVHGARVIEDHDDVRRDVGAEEVGVVGQAVGRDRE